MPQAQRLDLKRPLRDIGNSSGPGHLYGYVRGRGDSLRGLVDDHAFDKHQFLSFRTFSYIPCRFRHNLLSLGLLCITTIRTKSLLTISVTVSLASSSSLFAWILRVFIAFGFDWGAWNRLRSGAVWTGEIGPCCQRGCYRVIHSTFILLTELTDM